MTSPSSSRWRQIGNVWRRDDGVYLRALLTGNGYLIMSPQGIAFRSGKGMALQQMTFETPTDAMAWADQHRPKLKDRK